MISETTSSAEAYLVLARFAIAHAAFPHDLRLWWREEADHREDYALSPEQEAELIRLCREKIAELEAAAERYAVI